MSKKSPVLPPAAAAGVILLALLLAPGARGQPLESAGCEPMRTLHWTSPALTGLDVLELQERLEELGYGPLAKDGVYGSETVAAVRAFQRDHGLAADGVAGPLTWQALGAGSAPASAPAAAQPTGELSIVVDIDRLTLTLYADGEPFKTYPVAVGRPTQFTQSPVGEWKIIQKSRNWGGGFGTRWLGLNVPWGIYGIHGTNKPWSIGRRASAGCIRMHNRDVEELYQWVSIGTPVIIRGTVPDVPLNRTLAAGHSGRDVVFLQFRLADLGFDPQGADGRFGPNTERAVEELQRLYGLPVDGRAYEDVYYVLGLK